MSRCVAALAFLLVMLASTAAAAQSVDSGPSTSPAAEPAQRDDKRAADAMMWMAKIGALGAVFVFIFVMARRRNDDDRSGRGQPR